jgi:hypothetical protein
MADDTTTAKPKHDPKTEPAPKLSKAAAPEKSALGRLRAFEDEHFGEDCVRINDKIERGVGSPYAAMSDEQKAHYVALERLIEAERKGNEANEAMSIAKSDYDAALIAVDAAAKAVDEAKVRADEQAAAAQARADARAAKQPAKANA